MPKKKTQPKLKKPNTPPPPRIRKSTKDRRIERIQGLTNLMRLYHSTKETRYLEQAKEHTLTHYIQHSLSLQGRKITIQQLATYIRLPEYNILERIGEIGKELWKLTEDGASSGLRAMKALILRNSLEAQQYAEKQASILLNEQNGHYVPFLSTATNAAIANYINSNKPLLDLLRTIMPTGPTVAIQNNFNKAVPAEKAIGANEAIMLINQQKEGITLLENPEGKQKLLEQYILPEVLPEVIATKQQGTQQVDLSANIYQPTKLKKHESRNESNGTFIPLPE